MILKMKTFCIFCVLLVHSQCTNNEKESAEWIKFKASYNKSYQSASEDRTRFDIFKNNLKEIEDHNKHYESGDTTYYKGVNYFADMSQEEFLSYISKYSLKNVNATNLFKSKATRAAAVDWRNNGVVTEVKNQGECGSCWSFSATGSLEGQYAVVYGELLSFSEQDLMDCSTFYGNSGCNGGAMDNAFEYIRDNGIETEDKYPYEGVQGRCRQTSYATKLYTWRDIPQRESTLADAVNQVGPISVGIEATSNMQLYKGGIFVDSSCSDKINHGVLIVGYGSENGKDYWIVKNSWSESWGEKGYIRMARNNGNMCGIANMASYPVLLGS